VVREFEQKAASHAMQLLRIELSLLQRTPQQRLLFFQWDGQPQKLAIPLGDLDPIYM